LRWAVVEYARSAVRYDVRFCEFYGRVKVRRGDQKTIVAVANKMLKVVWVMLTRRETYSGVNQRLYEEKLNRVGLMCRLLFSGKNMGCQQGSGNRLS